MHLGQAALEVCTGTGWQYFRVGPKRGECRDGDRAFQTNSLPGESGAAALVAQRG